MHVSSSVYPDVGRGEVVGDWVIFANLRFLNKNTMKIDEEKLRRSLYNLRESELALSELIRNTGMRFSTNKLTGDLGEFYVKLASSRFPKLFESLHQPAKSNEQYDFIAQINTESPLYKKLNKETLRIEVKTRRDQSGVKYLSGVKPCQFDMLCMVNIASDYTLKNIFFIDSETVALNLDKQYGRLIFNKNMSFHEI